MEDFKYAADPESAAAMAAALASGYQAVDANIFAQQQSLSDEYDEKKLYEGIQRPLTPLNMPPGSMPGMAFSMPSMGPPVVPPPLRVPLDTGTNIRVFPVRSPGGSGGAAPPSPVFIRSPVGGSGGGGGGGAAPPSPAFIRSPVGEGGGGAPPPPVQFPDKVAPFVKFLNWVLFDPGNRANPTIYMRWDAPTSNMVIMVDEKQLPQIGMGANPPAGTMRGDAAGFGIKIGSSGKPNANISWQREMNRFGFQFQGKKTIGPIVYRTFVHPLLRQNDPRTIAYVTDTRQIQQFRPDRGMSPRSTTVRKGRYREPYAGDAKLGIPAAWQPNALLQSEQSTNQIRRLANFASTADLSSLITDLNAVVNSRIGEGGGGGGGRMVPSPIVPDISSYSMPSSRRSMGSSNLSPMGIPSMGPPAVPGMPPPLSFPRGVEPIVMPTPRVRPISTPQSGVSGGVRPPPSLPMVIPQLSIPISPMVVPQLSMPLPPFSPSNFDVNAPFDPNRFSASPFAGMGAGPMMGDYSRPIAVPMPAAFVSPLYDPSVPNPPPAPAPLLSAPSPGPSRPVVMASAPLDVNTLS